MAEAHRTISMRWKLLMAFAATFTLVFGFIAIWVVQYTTSSAQQRLVDELVTTAEGGAALLRPDDFEELVKTVAAQPEPDNPTGLGYPDSPLYRSQAQVLYGIFEITDEAFPYTYFRDPEDGQLYFAASGGYFLEPQFGATYRQPVADVVSPQTYQRMEKGLTQTTKEPPYKDGYGSWISVYAPVTNSAGEVVGGIGVDYRLTYVDEVREQVLRDILPVLIISYLVLLALVMITSSALVRPLRRLTAATRRVADGEYSLDVRTLVKSRFPDEMYELGESFTEMAEKVGARERSLTQEVQRLQVEIDESKREASVKEIVETDFFSDLSSRAAEMRARMRGGDG